MKTVVMYTTERCAFCRNAKTLLAARNIAFEEVSLALDPEGRAELARRTGMMTFPQVIIDGEVLGGFRELLNADQDGTLESLLAD